MSVPYTDSEASEARQWSNRYGPPNAWTASLGTAARMIGRLLDERERLMAKQTVAAPGDDYIREWHEEFQRWKAVAEEKQDLRDHFAAAALTGLLTSDDVGEESNAFGQAICQSAYLWAGAMLRERANHSPDAGKMGQSSGGTYRAWVAQNAALVNAAKEKSAPRTPQADRLAEWERHGSDRWGLGVASDLYDLECRVAALEKANHDAPLGKGLGTGDTQEPVACSLTLTDAEREALEWGAKKMRLLGDAYDPERAATLRGLLERLG